MNDNKIILNKKTDLLKLTVSQILNTKIYNFKGPYFNQLYDEAIKLEESNSRKKKAFSKVSYNIEFIQFDVKFLSEFGQRIVITGSENIMGNWDPEKGLNLNWNEGNHWKSIIKSTEFFEYKLVIFEHNYVKSWENGENRKFDLKSIKEQIESTPTNLDKICIHVSGVNYIFYINTHILDILLEWND